MVAARQALGEEEEKERELGENVGVHAVTWTLLYEITLTSEHQSSTQD